jgi:hypothetical protein
MTTISVIHPYSSSKSDHLDYLEIKINDDITIDKIDQHARVRLVSNTGYIKIKEKINEHCAVYLKAQTFIEIGQKIDQHCRVTLIAGSQISIGEKIDNSSKVEMFVLGSGDVSIGQKVDQHSYARINVPNGHIFIGESVDQYSNLDFYCHSFPQRNDKGELTAIVNGSSVTESKIQLHEAGFWTENPE